MAPTRLKLAIMATSALAFECTRTHLANVASQYVDLMATGQHDRFENLAYNMVYNENNNMPSILNGTPAFGMTIDATRSMDDTTQCKTFTEIIVTVPKHRYVIHTQMTLNNEGDVSLINSLVTGKGDWAFNATGYKYWNSQEKWDPVPENKRSSREVIKAEGDAYAGRCDVMVHVPFGTPCARLEGGAYTGRGNLSASRCDLGRLPQHVPMVNRRYVIDEEMRIVGILLGFTGLDRTRNDVGTPHSYLFRVEDSKIRYTHTASACFVGGCGVNGTGVIISR
ncbi:hypothetical protein EK21DRAFT_100081 [Setomelanomma holmii]|uniref:DUF8021 domain-containing protein n=1 Tax=Setomelanomma holmii TaxID=210430 RepID=A0A9P4HCQ3_9PLEO|nr:hypothetical protein EK21DRAFT_100081 [Setomelanomma holmii]